MSVCIWAHSIVYTVCRAELHGLKTEPGDAVPGSGLESTRQQERSCCCVLLQCGLYSGFINIFCEAWGAGFRGLFVCLVVSSRMYCCCDSCLVMLMSPPVIAIKRLFFMCGAGGGGFGDNALFRMLDMHLPMMSRVLSARVVASRSSSSSPALSFLFGLGPSQFVFAAKVSRFRIAMAGLVCNPLDVIYALHNGVDFTKSRAA